ncbi:hypothetical protein ACP3V3_02800 [Vibrio sp. PNB22_3_1]
MPKNARPKTPAKHCRKRYPPDELTGHILEFVAADGYYRRIVLLHSRHLARLLDKFRLESNYLVTNPEDEREWYPKHKQSHAPYLSCAEDGVACMGELLAD